MHIAALAAGFVTISTASAFLIPPAESPPNFQKTEDEVKSGVASLFGADAQWHVELECPDCPWAGTEDINGTQVQWGQDIETTLQLQISADLSNGLLINNVTTLLPLPTGPHAISIPLVATQKRLDTGATTPPFPVDFILERLEPLPSPSDPRRFLLPIKFTIVGFAAQPVHVDTLAIDLLSTPHLLSVLRIHKVPFASTPGAAECEEDENTWSLCRVRAIVMHRVIETMRTMREKAHRAKGWVRGGRGCHRGHANAHGGYGHYRTHRWAKKLHSMLRFFAIPALLGVIGGLLASAVGMLVGQFILFLWLRLGRRGRRGPSRREFVVVGLDEKRGLLNADAAAAAAAAVDKEVEDDEALPCYGENAPPGYEDVEAQGGEERS